MLSPGDLVKIKDTAFKYFANRLAIVDHSAHIEEYYNKDGSVEKRNYYSVTLSGTTSRHVFPEEDLIVLSKVQNNNE